MNLFLLVLIIFTAVASAMLSLYFLALWLLAPWELDDLIEKEITNG